MLQAWNAYILNVQHIGREAWLRKLDTARIRFEKRTLTGAKFRFHKLSREAGISCLTWGDPCPCCFEITQRISRGVYSLSSPWSRAHISSEMRDAMLICNRSTSAMGACFAMALLSHRMYLVVLVGETLKVNLQLDARLPAVVRRRIAAPANKITRSLPLHVTVVQDTLHVKEMTTVRIHQWLWLGREYQLRISRSCRRRLVVSSNVDTICEIPSNKRGRSVFLFLEAWVQRIHLYRSEDRSEFASYQLENERARQVLATKWLTFVARMLRYRARLRSWLGTKRIS